MEYINKVKRKRKIYKCPHHYIKYNCNICNRNLICPHDKYIKLCVKCNTSLLCIHNIYKYGCVICRPHLLCIHNIRRHRCKEYKIYYSKYTKIKLQNKENKESNYECIHKNKNNECIYCYLINFK